MAFICTNGAPSDCVLVRGVLNDLTVGKPENEMAYETRDSEPDRANTPPGVGDDVLPGSEDLNAAAAAGTAEVKAAASNFRFTVKGRAERMRTSTAEGLDSAASAAHAGGERVASAAHRTGDALASGAEYVREHDVADMMDDLLDLVRNNPGPALLCAAALGFVLGRAVYRS